MEGLQVTIPRRMQLVKSTAAIAFAISIFFSLRLWGGIREFPLTPVLELPLMRQGPDLLLPVAAVILLLSSLIFRLERLLLSLAMLILLYLVCADISRFQVWTFMYLSLLLIFVVYNGRVDDPNRYTSYFIMLQVIVAGFYFYSGLHQLNEGFRSGPYADLVAPLRTMVSERQYGLLLRCAAFSPFLFMFTGFSLIVLPIRYLGISLSILIHLAVIILRAMANAYTPAADFIFNIAMMLSVLLLFSGKTKQRYYSPAFLFQNLLFYLVIAFYVVLPFFNAAGQWPEQLSWNYNSGNNTRGKFIISEQAYKNAPLLVRYFCVSTSGGYVLDHTNWFRSELHATVIPSEKMLRQVEQELSNGAVKEIELQVEPFRPFLRKP